MASLRVTSPRLGHSDPFWTPFRRRRKTVRITPGTPSELNRNGVRNESECCPDKIGIASNLARNTQQVIKVFNEVERAKLLPLPSSLFPVFEEAPRSVHRDGYVEVQRAYYSVPPEYVGRQVWVRWESKIGPRL